MTCIQPIHTPRTISILDGYSFVDERKYLILRSKQEFMFFGFSSTIISIIFGLGLNWILIIAGQDLFHKIMNNSKTDGIEVWNAPVNPKLISYNNHDGVVKSVSSSVQHDKSIFVEIEERYTLPSSDLHPSVALPSVLSLRGPPSIV